jgi:ATP-dependent DNA helicase RecQ
VSDININKVLFLDLEPFDSDKYQKRIREIGVVIEKFQLKHASAGKLFEQLEPYKPIFLCGHNLRKFDCSYLNNSALNPLIQNLGIIDTLELSLLFFSENTLHKLPKSYKDKDTNRVNDPLKDAILTKELLLKIIERFHLLSITLQTVYFSLLSSTSTFQPFFNLINTSIEKIDKTDVLLEAIKSELGTKIQSPENLTSLISEHPVEVAHMISVLHGDIEEIRSFPLKLFFDYPNIQEQFNRITFNKDNEITHLESSALKYFGFDSFRSFPKFKSETDLFAAGEVISQRDIAQATLERKDILTVLPTGGGKTFTFWLPAIIKAKRTRALTVVISPLQALMKDHIFNFNKNLSGLASAEALSGYLTLPERRTIIKRVINGSVDILYLAPESLRSRNIEKLLAYRYIERIVIDEAHCLSTWGNDFRHDYYYIAQFIKIIQDKKYNQRRIPISCFTATANQNTIKEIEKYFKEHLDITFKYFIASPKRNNLTYSAKQYSHKKEKTKQIIAQIRSIKDPCLVYNPSSRKQCEMLSEQLSSDLGRPFYAFHAGMSSSDKGNILIDFISNKVDGIVATTAFGMGIDKPDIRHVIHYEVSSSLEDYMQESGRAGRDGEGSHCHILYNDEDFDKLFFSLIRQKVTQPEIRKIFQAIKSYKGRKSGNERCIVVSVNELAESAGMKTDDEQSNFDTKVKTAILELERAGYLRRGYNKPNVWVTAFHFDSMEALHQILKRQNFSANSEIISERALYQSIILLAQVLIKRSTQRFSIAVENLAEILNLEVDEVYLVLDKMRELDLVSLKEDLVVSNSKIIKLNQLNKNSIPLLKKFLASSLQELSQKRFKLKELNNRLTNYQINIDNYSYFLKYLLLNLTKKGQFECYRSNVGDHSWHININNNEWLQQAINLFLNVLEQVIHYLISHIKQVSNNEENKVIIIAYETMVHHCNHNMGSKIPINQYDKAILFLHNIRLIRLEGGRVLHHMQVELFLDSNLNSRKQYTKEDYKQRMSALYQRKRASIHIMNHYVELLSHDPMSANLFSIDYFTLGFDEFVDKYKIRKKIKLPMSKQRYERIFSDLTNDQKSVVFDDNSSSMLILAGPGTGKTKVLVNKIAYMIVECDYKPEHFLMLTFTRSAAHEFKQRLFDLLSDLAYDIDIYTFHGYATELAGISFDNNQKSENNFDQLIPEVTKKLKSDELFLPFKNAVILDEFQDVNDESFRFIIELYKQFSQMKNEDRYSDVRMIAVGDDDQCIMEMTNGANIGFMRKFVESFEDREDGHRKWYKLSDNFRSKSKIVECNNLFVSQIHDRLDPNKKILPVKKQSGDVHLNYYRTPYFLTALLPLVQSSNNITIALLAHENEQVLDIYSILKEDTSLDVSYLLKNEGFHLYMLDEISTFSHFIETNLEAEDNIISQKLFDDAKKHLKERYSESSKLNLALKHIDEFEEKHELLTLSFWNNYTYEVFTGSLGDIQSKIVVSTVHRSKGKEFDEVHVILQQEHNQITPDYFKRLYYVALSRAKTSLNIHSFPRKPFKILEKLDIKVSDNTSKTFNPINKRILIMQLEDTYLSFLSRNKKSHDYVSSNRIMAGTAVQLKKDNDAGGFSIIHNDIVIARTSKKFSEKLKKSISKNYSITDCEIEYVAKWFCSDREQFNDIFLCKISLTRLTGGKTL